MPEAPIVPPVIPDALQWFKDVDAETLGHIQNRGWDKKPANEAVLEAVKAHREAAKLIGAPETELVRIPKSQDGAAIKAMWEKLGMPKDAKDYDFSKVTRGGKPLEESFTDALRKAATEGFLTKEAAIAVATNLTKFLDAQDATKFSNDAAALKQEKEALAKDWGPQGESHMLVAKNAAKALGITELEINTLEKVVGFSRVMNMFRNIGSKIGEDKFMNNDTGGGNRSGVMTRDMATARIGELTKDAAWSKRYLDGGHEEAREMRNLQIIANGVAA